MTFDEAYNYIEETPKFTKKHSLSHTREALRRLGNPEKNFRVIHVAGTNGKGSTCAFLFSILKEAGYRCGLFTSPHLINIRERFIIQNEMVSSEEFLRAFHRVYKLSQELEAEGAGHPTYFEMLFLMGMLIFSDAEVEYVMLETGLGGRLDATTAVENPDACVITSISLDHMQYLGDTVEKIAREKAGIIVPGVPVIYDADEERASKVIRETAEKEGCPSFPVGSADTEVLKKSRGGIDFSVRNGYYVNSALHIPFIAGYQVMNAALAVRTVEVLTERCRIRVTGEQLARGLAGTRWPGRMEEILPGVFVDGAHNEDGVRKFVDTVSEIGKETPVCLLFSAVNDKDYHEMIREIQLRLHPEFVVTTQVGGKRAADPWELKTLFEQMGCRDTTAFEDPVQAFRFALEHKKKDSILFCAGSLYLVGIIEKVIRS